VSVNDDRIADHVRCAFDPCHFYWHGRNDADKPFAGNGARASEIMGAMLNVQLDRLDGMIGAMRAEKKSILAGVASLGNLGLKPTPMNSPDYDCSTQVMFTFPSAETANNFTRIFPSVIAGKTGRHTFTEWDQVLMRAGAAHPAMNPYTMPANAECRTNYPEKLCVRSLDILSRTVMVATHPLHGREEINDIIHNIASAARIAFGEIPAENAAFRNLRPVDAQKFDMKDEV
jgi:hypothetical protein